jgi:tripartite-type tricarboxylate transporter receptor subunit TctC
LPAFSFKLLPQNNIPENQMNVRIKATLIAAACITAFAAQAQTPAPDKRQIAPGFPSKPLKLVTTVTAGGGLDFITRTVAAKLGERLPVAVVVENVSGANGIIAVNMTMNAPPDGHLLLSTGGSTAINAVFKKFDRDVKTALAPVAQVSFQPYVLYAPLSSPANNFREFVDYVRKNPGKVSYGSTGVGSVIHLGTALMAYSLGLDMVHIPYKGSAAPMVDLASGRLTAYIGSYVSGAAQVKSGKLKAFAVTGPQRMTELPDVPTIAESGIPGYDLTNTYTLYTAGATPIAIINALNKEVAQALTDPDLRKKFLNDNSTPAPPRSPDELRKIFLADMEKWDGVVKRANIKLEE